MALWFDMGTRLTVRRTSLIVDPPDGKVPPLTTAGQQRSAEPRRRTGCAPHMARRIAPCQEQCLSTRVPVTSTAALSSDAPIYEYACHEGNHTMPLIPLGARAGER